jgi:hypothetical protein
MMGSGVRVPASALRKALQVGAFRCLSGRRRRRGENGSPVGLECLPTHLEAVSSVGQTPASRYTDLALITGMGWNICETFRMSVVPGCAESREAATESETFLGLGRRGELDTPESVGRHWDRTPAHPRSERCTSPKRNRALEWRLHRRSVDGTPWSPSSQRDTSPHSHATGSRAGAGRCQQKRPHTTSGPQRGRNPTPAPDSSPLHHPPPTTR